MISYATSPLFSHAASAITEYGLRGTGLLLAPLQGDYRFDARFAR
jgi:hypothetical protein